MWRELSYEGLMKIMDFYCRYVYARDPTCEGYMLRLASKLHYLDVVFPGWCHEKRTYWT